MPALDGTDGVRDATQKYPGVPDRVFFYFFSTDCAVLGNHERIEHLAIWTKPGIGVRYITNSKEISSFGLVNYKGIRIARRSGQQRK